MNIINNMTNEELSDEFDKAIILNSKNFVPELWGAVKSIDKDVLTNAETDSMWERVGPDGLWTRVPS